MVCLERISVAVRTLDLDSIWGGEMASALMKFDTFFFEVIGIDVAETTDI